MPEVAMTHFVAYGRVVTGAVLEYCVVSTRDGLVFEADSKPDCIAYAQRKNGFTPVDGEESTFVRQVAGA